MVEFDVSTLMTQLRCSKSPFLLCKYVANHSHALKIVTSILANQNQVTSHLLQPHNSFESGGDGGGWLWCHFILIGQNWETLAILFTNTLVSRVTRVTQVIRVDKWNSTNVCELVLTVAWRLFWITWIANILDWNFGGWSTGWIKIKMEKGHVNLGDW